MVSATARPSPGRSAPSRTPAAFSKMIVNVPLRLLEGDTYAEFYVLG
jgi:hypothetical protein